MSSNKRIHMAAPELAETAVEKSGRTGRNILSHVPATLLVKFLSVFTILGLWYAATSLHWVSPIFLPSPVDVFREARSLVEDGELLRSVLQSSKRVFAGFALAAVISVPLGILMATWWPAKAALDPIISLLRPLPSITWIPLTILWLGIGEGQKTAIVFMGSWIYVLIYTFESTKRVDPLLIRAARNLGAKGFSVMHVVLMAALPGIISGLKVTLAIAWSCVITAEMIAAQIGLGAIIWRAKDGGNLGLVLVGMLGISITVLVADFLVDRLERILIPWERLRR